MPGAAWGEDSVADQVVIASNVATLLSRLVREGPNRARPAVSLAHGWHQEIHEGVRSVPAAHYLGAVRGGGHPDLAGYEVVLYDPVTAGVVAQGVPSLQVPEQLRAFEHSLRRATTTLDSAIGGGGPDDEAQLLAVVELAAVLHGEWVRIHPYPNGNGRTARTWSNWVAIRYGLPPFVAIKPRPDALLYGQAARRSMGVAPTFVPDHSLTVHVFLDLLRRRP